MVALQRGGQLPASSTCEPISHHRFDKRRGEVWRTVEDSVTIGTAAETRVGRHRAERRHHMVRRDDSPAWRNRLFQEYAANLVIRVDRRAHVKDMPKPGAALTTSSTSSRSFRGLGHLASSRAVRGSLEQPPEGMSSSSSLSSIGLPIPTPARSTPLAHSWWRLGGVSFSGSTTCATSSRGIDTKWGSRWTRTAEWTRAHPAITASTKGSRVRADSRSSTALSAVRRSTIR